MREVRHTIGYTILALVIVAGVVSGIFLKFTRIDDTDMRLFVDYWGWYLGGFIAAAIGVWLVRDS